MKDNMNDLVEKLYDLTRKFGVTWNTFNLVRYLVKNNVILNERLPVDDLETGMWVWNETQWEYQRVRYISTHDSHGSRHQPTFPSINPDHISTHGPARGPTKYY